MNPTPADLYLWPSFKFKHEVRPQERPYDYYEAHPEHRPRLLPGGSGAVAQSVEAEWLMMSGRG